MRDDAGVTEVRSTVAPCSSRCGLGNVNSGAVCTLF